jgi:hypothetical protein
MDELARLAARSLRTPRQQATYMLVEALTYSSRLTAVRRLQTSAPQTGDQS